MWANEVTSADGAGPLRFAFVALRRATAEPGRSAFDVRPIDRPTAQPPHRRTVFGDKEQGLTRRRKDAKVLFWAAIAHPIPS